MTARRDAMHMHRALHVIGAPETLQALFRPRSAVSRRLTRAAAAGTAVLSYPRTAAIPVQSRSILEWSAMSRDSVVVVTSLQASTAQVFGAVVTCCVCVRVFVLSVVFIRQ